MRTRPSRRRRRADRRVRRQSRRGRATGLGQTALHQQRRQDTHGDWHWATRLGRGSKNGLNSIDLMYAEATFEQIGTVLSQVRSEQKAFARVKVLPAPGVSWQQGLVQYNRDDQVPPREFAGEARIPFPDEGEREGGQKAGNGGGPSVSAAASKKAAPPPAATNSRHSTRKTPCRRQILRTNCRKWRTLAWPARPRRDLRSRRSSLGAAPQPTPSQAFSSQAGGSYAAPPGSSALQAPAPRRSQNSRRGLLGNKGLSIG